ncbi:MAG: ABC transporter ATP-binding protein [Spirochaetales bacterium]|nr:ABC transporter ATP-binding protein [Spirochaetales bacterium]
MIQTKHLTKVYRDLTAVNNLNLTIKAGEIYGFLGPNGAGKTSTIKMLLGLSRPTSGEIFLFGKKFTLEKVSMRNRIGVVPEKHPVGVWTWMTAFEYLSYFAALFEVKNPGPRIDYLLKKVNLYDVKNKPFRNFSRGMLQKLTIIRALLHDPDILILDEPISGLDPIGIKQVRDLILSENREGRIIFVSSHLLSEIEKICHRIGIIYRGTLIAEDTKDVLISRLIKQNKILIDVEKIPDGFLEEIKALDFVVHCTVTGLTLSVEVPMDRDYRRDIALFIFNKGLIPLRIQQKEASLEEAFMTITQENIEKFTGMGETG